jgi:hypothetical protein
MVVSGIMIIWTNAVTGIPIGSNQLLNVAHANSISALILMTRGGKEKLDLTLCKLNVGYKIASYVTVVDVLRLSPAPILVKMDATGTSQTRISVVTGINMVSKQLIAVHVVVDLEVIKLMRTLKIQNSLKLNQKPQLLRTLKIQNSLKLNQKPQGKINKTKTHQQRIKSEILFRNSNTISISKPIQICSFIRCQHQIFQFIRQKLKSNF